MIFRRKPRRWEVRYERTDEPSVYRTITFRAANKTVAAEIADRRLAEQFGDSQHGSDQPQHQSNFRLVSVTKK